MATLSIKNLLSGNMSKSMFGQNKKSAGTNLGYPRTLNKAGLWAVTGSDITLTANSWVRVGEQTIPPQQVWHLGQGISGGNPEEIGHVHFDVVDDTATNSAVEKGFVRLGMSNNGENLQYYAMEERSEDLSSTSTTVKLSKSDEILMPERTDFIPEQFKDIITGENSKIIVDFKADATDVIVEAGIGTGAINIWKVPITVYQ